MLSARIGKLERGAVAYECALRRPTKVRSAIPGVVFLRNILLTRRIAVVNYMSGLVFGKLEYEASIGGAYGRTWRQNNRYQS